MNTPELKHTPGPWCVGNSGITVFGRDGTQKISAPGTDVPLEEKAGNARLIAAAPALFNAAQRAREFLNWVVGPEGWIGPEAFHAAYEVVTADLDAALAQAVEGGAR